MGTRILAATIFLLCALILPDQTTWAQNLVTDFGIGRMDWTNRIVEGVGWGVARPDAGEKAQARAIAKGEASRQARENLFRVIEQLRIDEQRIGEHLLADREGAREKLRRVLQDARIVEVSFDDGGRVKATAALSLSGGVLHLLLPESIKPIHPLHQRGKSNAEKKESLSGLIVDARGCEIQPALVPRILDEEGKIVYGPEYMNRDFAAQTGTAVYIKDMDSALKVERIGKNPLVFESVRKTEAAPTDVVISNADAEQVRGSAGNIQLLQKCRVVIVLD